MDKKLDTQEPSPVGVHCTPRVHHEEDNVHISLDTLKYKNKKEYSLNPYIVKG